MTIYNVLQDYLSLTEGFLAEKQESLQQAQTRFLLKRGFSLEDIENQSIHTTLALLFIEDEEDADIALDYMSGYPHNIDHEFPNLFRKSFFVTVYSVFETGLHNRCKFMRKEFGLKIAVSDMAGRGIRRSKNYLEKVVGLNLSGSSEWYEILSYKNCETVLFIVVDQLKAAMTRNFSKTMFWGISF